MSDDALIVGAAAPVGARRIRSAVVLDVAWVSVTAVALLVSSRFALIDLPNQYLRTGDAPLRVWVVGLPVTALLVAAFAGVRRSLFAAALATGILAPAVAFGGSLAVSLFLNESSAFADAGVAVSLGAALIGVAMLLRWLVYHPAGVLTDEPRPTPRVSLAVVAVGVTTGIVIVVGGVIDDGSWSPSFVFQTMLIVVVPLLIAACGMVRTRSAMALAVGAAIAQIIGVVVVRAEQSSLPLDSDLLLRTGLAGIALLCLAAGLCGRGFVRHAVDEVTAASDDDADWRWTVTD